MRFVEAKCRTDGCNSWLPSMAVGLANDAEDDFRIKQSVEMQAESHASSYHHEVVVETVFR